MSTVHSIDNILLFVDSNESISVNELRQYIDRLREKYPDREFEKIELKFDGDFVEIKTYLKPRPFERIRRITGYLVGTLDRFNDAKRAEEHDRVRHTT